MVTVADTAYSIAVVRAEEIERAASERLFCDPYASVFRAAGAHAEEATKRFFDLPFFRDGVRLRTRFIDDWLREGLAAGLRQVVVLGAGFDTRGLRIAEIASCGAAVYEVDFGEQLEKKRALLAAAGVALPASIAHVACDFARGHFEQALIASLEAHGFQTGAGVLFVWEGVVAYLDDAAIDRSLGFMARAGGAGSRVAFEFSPFRFDNEPIADRARRAGFRMFEETGFDELWRRHLPGEPHPAAAVVRMGVAAR